MSKSNSAKVSDRRRPMSNTGKAGRPPSLQVAALCYRRSGKGMKILLITSRDTGRWVIPKGWPMRNRTRSEAAAREAYEEAGIRGKVAAKSIGFYTYMKWLGKGRSIPCVVRIYPLEVQEMLKRYPESGQRQNRWFSAGKAAKKVAEKDLAALIRDFDPDAEN